jgi:hypothetical protein
VTAVLDQAALQISREREASQPRTPLLLLPELLRNALTSLALALGFAALARWPGSAQSLLQEWQGGAWGDWQWRLERRRAARRGGAGALTAHLRELGRGDRDSQDNLMR